MHACVGNTTTRDVPSKRNKPPPLLLQKDDVDICIVIKEEQGLEMVGVGWKDSMHLSDQMGKIADGWMDG